MPVQILMPALSPTMTEGNLVRWLKKEGDSIKSGQVLAEIETDKATMEVEAVDEGTLGKILIPEGTEAVKVNEVIALILEEGEEASALKNFTPKTLTSPSSAEVAQTPRDVSLSAPPKESPLPSSLQHNERIIASPVAKRLANNVGLDLKNLKGTGPRGRIVKADVEPALLRQSAPLLPHTSPSSFTDLPLSGMRKTIAKRLVESKQTVPHFYLSVSCTIDTLLNLRAQINEKREKSDKISVNDFVILACAKALSAVPDANVSFHENFIRKYTNADISVAVAMEGGLITPIIKNAGARSLSQISSEMKSLAQRARDGKLQPEEYQGGSFCVSNLGMYGVEQFQAIINPPQACILAVGAGKETVVVKNGEMHIATVMNCTLSVDHRAVDGALGATFLQHLKSLLENPVEMLV